MSARSDLIGRSFADVPTPVAVVDSDALRSNVGLMARNLRAAGVDHRPHTKTHKCREIAALQLAAGAVGVTCATLGEAQAMATVGLPANVLLARSLAADPAKVPVIAALARDAHVTLVVDETDQVEAIARACRQAGSRVALLVELDIGFGRAGCRSVDRLVEVARSIDRLDGVEFAGLMGYEAHAMGILGDQERHATVHGALDRLAEAKARCEAAGLGVRVVSAGGTITYLSVAEHPVVTEVRAGGYVFMHATKRPAIPELAGFRHALSVLSTVIGSYPDGRVVLDAGVKSVSTDGGTALLVRGLEGATVAMATEEHLVLDVSGVERRPQTGERFEIVSTHSCTTANLHGRYLVRSGGSDTIADVWPVTARY